MQTPLDIVAEDEPRPTIAQAEAAGQQAFDFMTRTPFKARPAARLPPAAAAAPASTPDPAQASAPGLAPRPPFGQWLLRRGARKGWVGELARAFQTDRNFPRPGAPDDVRRYLRDVRAEGDAYEALDDAELDWASL